MLDIINREQLTGPILDTVEHITSRVRSFFSREHKETGEHADVTADSLSLQGARVGELIEVPYDTARFFADGSAVWTIDENDYRFFRYSRIGQLVFFQFDFRDTTIATDTTDFLAFLLPELHAIPNRIDLTGSNFQVCGLLEWSDTSGGGIGNIIAVPEALVGFPPKTRLEFQKVGDADGAFHTWSIGTNNVSLRGSGWFTVQPDNIPVNFT